MIAKLDVGPKGAVVTFADGGFPDLPGLLAYVERLKGAAKLRPDSKLSVSRDWPHAGGAAQRRACSFRAGWRGSPRRAAKKKELEAGLGRAFDLRGGDEARQLFMVKRAGTEKALIKVAAPFGEQYELRRAFHALDNHLEVELAGEADHGA